MKRSRLRRPRRSLTFSFCQSRMILIISAATEGFLTSDTRLWRALMKMARLHCSDHIFSHLAVSATEIGSGVVDMTHIITHLSVSSSLPSTSFLFV